MDTTLPVPAADRNRKISEHAEVHEILAKSGLTALPHECSVVACPGAYRWKGYAELVEGARYVLNGGHVAPEAQSILKAALFKLDSVASAERGSSQPSRDIAP